MATIVACAFPAPYYSHGLKVTILTRRCSVAAVSVVDVHEWFETLRPSWYSAGPALLAILEAARAHPEGLGRQQRPRFASSAALRRGDHRQLRAHHGLPLLEHYGSSEAAQIAANTRTRARASPARSGVHGRRP